MKDYYELGRDNFWHLKEYHEILFFRKRHEIKDRRVRDNLEEFIENESYDIWKIIPFKSIEKLETDYNNMNTDTKYPDLIYAAGNMNTLAETDYPIVKNSNLLIISKGFLDALLPVKQFEFIAVPVTVYDATEKEPFLENGELTSLVERRTDFLYIKLLNFINIDRENSVFRSGKHPQDNFDFKKLSLQIPEDGLDPIFRLRQFPNPVLINKEACKAAKKQGIKGVCLFGFPDPFTDNIEDFFHDYYKDDEE
ncbi:hypothetical protein FACS189496_1510 [Bacilli bacterium]|nr:hypothetical protein FACS189496_1510 [Bacilli bacterium]